MPGSPGRAWELGVDRRGEGGRDLPGQDQPQHQKGCRGLNRPGTHRTTGLKVKLRASWSSPR